MHVKLEPNDQLELSVDLITDIESDIFREQLFGNINLSNSDVSESSSDDDHLSRSLGYESVLDTGGPFGHSLWESSSRSDSSISDSFEQTLGEMELSTAPLHTIRTQPLDVESATCSQPDFLMSPLRVKEESNTPPDWYSDSVISGDDSTNPIWDLLCSSDDIKPNIKTLETPPVTPPGVYPLLGESPPPSPSSSLANGTLSSSSSAVLPSTTVITVTNLHPKPPDTPTPPRKKVALAPKIPFKIVTTITANESASKCQVPRTIKIQPKSLPTAKPVISVSNSTVPKFTFGHAGPETTRIKFETKPVVQNPVVIATPSTAPLSSFTSSTPVAVSNNVSVGSLGTEQKPGRLPLLAPALNPSLKNTSIAELRALKRQQRMIKNRESASLSRKRKKEYLEGLEDKVRELDLENARLKTENERLLRRVTSLENEKVIMRAARFPVKRSSTAILGFAFLLLFNASPLMNIFVRESPSTLHPGPWTTQESLELQGDSLESRANFPRRSLLSVSPLETLVGSQRAGTPSANLSHVCPISFNSTESIRIENELRDWFDSSRQDWSAKPKQDSLRNPTSFNKPTTATERTPRRDTEDKRALAAPLTSAFPSAATYQFLYRHEHQQHPHSLENARDKQRPLGGLVKLGENIESLLDSIDRRNDTYYVVSLTADHLLLPATAHNTSARPKMSLLVPTPKDHGERPDQVGLMQIDCVVTHTRLIRWNKHHPGVPLPSVPTAEPLPEARMNASDPKEASIKYRSFAKKRKMRKYV